MEYKFVGRIIATLPERSGTSQAGKAWKSQSYVIQETEGKYPKTMVFDVFGEDKINTYHIQNGEDISVSFDINAHEYQGKWYNSVQAYKVERATAPQGMQMQQNPFQSAPQVILQPQVKQQPQQTTLFDDVKKDEGDNLPF